jgi:hypothetical protein
MKIVPAIEDKLRREVRSAVAKNPLFTVVAMQEVFGRTFSFRYTSKLMNKVAGQARREVDAAKMQDRIVQLRHTHSVARERLMQSFTGTNRAPSRSQQHATSPRLRRTWSCSTSPS